MVIRPQLKKLYDLVNAKRASDTDWHKYSQILDGADFSAKKQRAATKFLKSHAIKLRPFAIKAGTTWIEKSSSGNIGGTFAKTCRAIGIVHDCVSPSLLLDRPTISSDNGYPLRWDDNTISLCCLSTELLEKTLAAVV